MTGVNAQQSKEYCGAAGQSLSLWRLMMHGRGEAAWNMSVDEAMLRATIVSRTLPTLRLYQWEGYAVSIGRFQSIERTIRVDAKATDLPPLVRRITGGRGILHGDDLTVSMTCRCSDLGVGSHVSLTDIYAVLTGIFQQALAQVGIDAAQGPKARFEPSSTQGDCFAIASRSDLIHEASGAKLVGGAIHRSEDAILFQASIPLFTVSRRDGVQEMAERVFLGSSSKIHSSGIPPILREELKRSIVRVLCQQLGAEIVASDQTELEKSNTVELQTARYCNPAWTQSARSIGDLVPN